MRKLFMFLGLAVVVLVQPSQAQILKYKAFMDGPSENPPVPSPGTGTATVTFDLTAVMMHVEADFADLVGTTTVAHIHCCVDPPGTVGVATYPGTFPGFPVGVTAGTYDATIDMSDTASYTAAILTAGGGTAEGALDFLLNGINAGQAYFNIHTSFRSGGEIRGFLFFVPEPSSFVLAVFSAVGLLIGRRRK